MTMNGGNNKTEQNKTKQNNEVINIFTSENTVCKICHPSPGCGFV